MAIYSLRKTQAVNTPDTGTVAYLSMIPAATRSIRIQEVSSSGLGTASAANEYQLTPAPAGTTPGAAVTPFPLSPLGQVAAGFTTATTYATAPVRPAQGGIAYGVNANGGTYRWLAKTNFELISMSGITNSATMAWAVVVGTSTMSGHVIVEEI
jgi:hypothetical protein